MCPPDKRQDAISAITLVESTASLLTQGLFGTIFAAFTEAGTPSLTFFCNAVRHEFSQLSSIQYLLTWYQGFAVFGFIILFLAYLPPPNSKRIDDEDSETEVES